MKSLTPLLSQLSVFFVVIPQGVVFFVIPQGSAVAVACFFCLSFRSESEESAVAVAFF
jgi:hypothetical protein